jgi:hypothetical protein
MGGQQYLTYLVARNVWSVKYSAFAGSRTDQGGS